MTPPEATGLVLYDRAADAAAASVIRLYSTSFGWATRLLGPRVRTHVRNVYALVRVADEIVDGPAAQAGLDTATQLETLDALEAETARAVDRGFSANLVVHAFARTARSTGIPRSLTSPFFASMRSDAADAAPTPAVVRSLDADAHSAYVYGSAEVIGLMCLHIFVNAGRAAHAPLPDALVDGARRLGAAFQDVNFLRDIDADNALARDYLALDSQSTPRERARARDAVLARIDADLAVAARTIPLLPADCRRAVTAAYELFAELTQRLRARGEHPGRVSVPAAAKARILLSAACGRVPIAPRDTASPGQEETT